MAYFPAFIKLDNIKILIIGGGYIAYEKLSHLVDFTTNIEVIAKDYSDDMIKLLKQYNIPYDQRSYEVGDITDFGLVIVAIDDIPLQNDIFNEAKKYPKCLVNSVDSTDYCDFIFPSYIKKGDLTIAVSTSGSSPAVAKYLRRYLEVLIPNSIVDFLKEMKSYRKTMPKGKKRMEFLDDKAKVYMEELNKK